MTQHKRNKLVQELDLMQQIMSWTDDGSSLQCNELCRCMDMLQQVDVY